MRIFAYGLMLLLLAIPALLARPAAGAAVDEIADALVQAAEKPTITPDSLPADFARLARFVRHDASGMVLFTDGGSTDGYVRHAQAHFDTAPAAANGPGALPLFSLAFEFVDQPDFSFDGLAAALEQRLGTPSARSDQTGATFRTWQLKQPAGRTVTIARAQASDNGDPITIVQMMQSR
jgi:hypothetical protein